MYHLRLIKEYCERIVYIKHRQGQPDLWWKLKHIGLKWFLKLPKSDIYKCLCLPEYLYL